MLDTSSSADRGFSERVLRAWRRRNRRRSGGCRVRAGYRHLPALEQALREMHVHGPPFVLDLREPEFMDCDSRSGRVRPRMLRL